MFFAVGTMQGALVNQTVAGGIHHFTLDNGLTVLVRSTRDSAGHAPVPKVAVQIWYGVGSRDEDEGTRGIAHLIEHMIFKGTHTLSESDINTVVHMLSGNCNAFTSYDYTGYLFNLPTHHWQESLPVIADCMRNCTFKPDMLNSEMKAVIQELKMYKDNYLQTLVEDLLAAVFAGHPYHHPIIGYKRDLWSVSPEGLKKFYNRYYIPGNASLVVTGDVDPQEVLSVAKKYFSDIPVAKVTERQAITPVQDIAAKSVTIYRDVQHPTMIFSFVVPGVQEKNDHTLHLLEWVFGRGRGSRLYQKLVHELGIATSVQAMTDSMFQAGLFIIICEPRSVDDMAAVKEQVLAEVARVVQDGITDQEFTRAYKQVRMSLFSLLEDVETQAHELGYYFWAARDPEYAFTCLDTTPQDELKKQMLELARNCFRSTVMHEGTVLPLPESEKGVWASLQAASDAEDNAILEKRHRDTQVEPPSYANTLQVTDAKPFDFPKAQKFTLSNGIEVLHHHSPLIPKLSLIIDFRARHHYDPDDKQGLLLFLNRLLVEGTKNYPGMQFAQVLEERGIALSSYPGGIAVSLLEEDLPFVLDLLYEMVTVAQLESNAIERVRVQLLTALKNFWDEPRNFTGQLIKQELYKGHAYEKNRLGSVESISALSRDDLLACYERCITSDGARIALVGDLHRYDIKALLEEKFGHWCGKELKEIEFPALEPTQRAVHNHQINRDQVVIALAGRSIDRCHPDFDKLLLFDQVFGGGSLGSMSSRLFQLREQSGLFYSIGGTLVAGAGEQPGMVLINTQVSTRKVSS